MIEFVKECDLFDIEADVYVVTVNCVGVMGKGVALRVKQQYPEVEKKYKKVCNVGQLRPGEIFLIEANNGKLFLCAATKNHWRNPSEYEWVGEILVGLRLILEGMDVSVVLPPLGCGNGMLSWKVVRCMIQETLSDVQSRIFVLGR